MKKITKAGLTVVILGLVVFSAVKLSKYSADTKVTGVQNIPAQITADAIGLPTNGVVIASTDLLTTEQQTQYYRIKGFIKAVDPQASDIEFQVNLPLNWNHKMVQFGGGGMNGSLVTADDHAIGEAVNEPTLLAQGYVTYGSDSGHKGDIWDASFGMNKEALHNYAHEQLKKTKDTAATLVKAFYGEQADKVYMIGGSNGGRETLQAIQHYPEDYDGVVVFYPVLNWIPKAISDNRNANFMQEKGAAGYFTQEEFNLVHDAYMKRADGLDGLEDGLVQNFAGGQRVAEQVMEDLSAVLRPEQMEVLKLYMTPMHINTAIADNYVDTPGYAIGQEFRDPPFNQFGTAPLKRDGHNAQFSSGALRYHVMQDPTLDLATFKPEDHAKEILEASEWLDATKTDLSAFRNRGGKLILLHGTSDQMVSVYSTIGYYKALQQRYGQEELQKFVRFYLVPGYGHGEGSFFTMGRSLIGDIDSWVTKNQAPEALVVTDQNKATAGRIQVLQPYPGYSRYVGGDKNDPASYVYAIEE
jgi:feruloyl esterase